MFGCQFLRFAFRHGSGREFDSPPLSCPPPMFKYVLPIAQNPKFAPLFRSGSLKSSSSHFREISKSWLAWTRRWKHTMAFLSLQVGNFPYDAHDLRSGRRCTPRRSLTLTV